jgi:hypothetical protein
VVVRMDESAMVGEEGLVQRLPGVGRRAVSSTWFACGCT